MRHGSIDQQVVRTPTFYKVNGSLPQTVGLVRSVMALLLLLLLVSAMPGFAQQNVGDWSAVGDLIAARGSHTATVLNDGRVLIAGGETSAGALNAAEIFDPTNGTIRATSGTMTVARKNHTATLLDDGRVLLIGGENSVGALASAEVYDPVTDTFAPTGAMSSARRFHTATTVNAKTVVIIGGEDGSGKANGSIERYNVSTGEFTVAAARLDAPRAQHTATLLLDGRVFIAGGRTGSTELASTSFYDPTADTVSTGPTLDAPRYAHTATRALYGDVVLAGGTPDGTQGYDTVAVFYRDGMMGVAASKLSVARFGHVTLELANSSNLLVLGGRNDTGSVAAVDYMDPESFAFKPAPSLLTPRSEFVAFSGNGRSCVAGGNNLFGPQSSIETARYPSLKSDRQDYPPNTQVTLTGSGWVPGEVVTLNVRQSDGDADINLVARADDQGDISNSELFTKNDAHVAFLVKGVGQTSNRTAYAKFTDLGATITLDPDHAPASGNSFTLKIIGVGFTLGQNTVYFQGVNLGSGTTVSDTEIDVTVPGGLASSQGSYSVVVSQLYTYTTSCCTQQCYQCNSYCCGFLCSRTCWNTCCNNVCNPCQQQATYNTDPAAFTVTEPLLPPALSKAFGSALFRQGSTTSLTFTVTNPNASYGLTGISFTDNLPAGLYVSGPNNLNNTCGGMPVAPVGAPFISLSGATVAQGATCTLSVDVTGTAIGVVNNVTTPINSTEGGTGAPASASVTVVAPISVAQSFSPATVAMNAPSSLTFTLTNGNPAPINSSFTNQLPPGLVVASPPNVVNNCGGTLGAGPGSPIISFLNPTLAPGTCTIKVDVQSAIDNVYSNSVTINSTDAGNGNTAVASLTVDSTTSTSVTSSQNPSGFGQSVKLTATVSHAAAGTPTGTVTFSDGGSPIGSGTLIGGVATITTSALAVGNHTITTNYAGDMNFKGSTGALTGNPQVINKANTNTVVTSAPNPSAFGSPVTLTATVSLQVPGVGTPTGIVTFMDGSTTLGTGLLNSSGQATYTISTLAVDSNHRIGAIFAGDTNFTESTSATWAQAVNKADTTTTVTSSRNSSTYGQSVTFTATISPVAPGAGTPTGTVTFLDGGSPIGSGTVFASGPNGVATFTTSTLAAANHTITTSYGGDSNFNGSTGSLTGNPQVVGKANAAVTANSFHKVYGSAYTPTDTEFTTSGLLNGDAVVSVTLTSPGFANSATVLTPGPTYTITPSAAVGTGLSNYSITYVNGTVTIDLRPLTVTANSVHKPYGTLYTPQGTEFTTSGLSNGDTVSSVTLTSAGFAEVARAVAPGPTYGIIPSAAVGTGLGNYTISYANGILTVDKATASVTPTGNAKTYGATDPTLTGTLNGFLASDNVTATYNRTAGETVAGSPYTISATLSPAAVLGNYNITYNTANFTINKANAGVTANSFHKGYGTLYTPSGAEFTASGFMNGDNVSSVTLSSTGFANAARVVAPGPTYSITPSAAVGTGLSNYTITYTDGTLTVDSAPVTVTANSFHKSYGFLYTPTGAEFTTSGLANGDNISSVTLASAGFAQAASVASPGPTYAITPSAAVGTGVGNYAITYSEGTLTVDTASLTVTPDGSKVKTYGQTFSGFTGQVTGLQNTDAVTVSYDSTGAPPTAGVGSYDITVAGVTFTSGAASNYNVTKNTATGGLTINKATASVTPTAASKPYGATDPTLAGTLSGFMAADNVVATYSRAAGETVTGSPYPISATLSPAAVLGNYNITYNTANFTISKAAASVTPTAASKTYGTTDPTLAGTLSGFMAADNVVATYTRVAGETVTDSPYPISATLAPAAVLGNYDITYNTAQFTINRAVASVTPSAASKTYGTSDPTLAGTLSGFVAADNVVARYSRAPGETVAGSPYTISATLTPMAALGNYDVTYGTASFTINKAPASATLQTSAPVVMLMSSITLTANVSSPNGTPTGNVSFMDGSTSLGSGPIDNTGTATLTLSTLSAGTRNLAVVYNGDSNFSGTTSAAVSQVVQDFRLTAVSGSMLSTTVLPGGAASYQLQIAPTAGTNFISSINLSLTGLPPGATYTITPTTISAGSGSQTITVQVQTAKTAAGLRSRGTGLPFYALGLLLPAFGIVHLGRPGPQRKKCTAFVLCVLIALAILSMSACGGRSGFLNQPSQTYTLQLNGASGALQHSATLSLTVQ